LPLVKVCEFFTENQLSDYIVIFSLEAILVLQLKHATMRKGKKVEACGKAKCKMDKTFISTAAPLIGVDAKLAIKAAL